MKGFNLGRRKRVDYGRLLKQLGVLLEQGYTLDDALSFILIHIPSPVNHCLVEVRHALQSGQEIHQALSILELPKDIIAFLYFYQFHGQISEGFIKAGFLLEKRQATKYQLQKLLRYPMFLIWICIIVLIVLHQFVVPHFNQLFQSMGGNPPKLTELILHMLTYIPYISFGLLVCFLFLGGWAYLSKNKWSPNHQIQFLLSLPFLRKYVRYVCTYFFSLQFGRLLSTGTSLQQALKIFEDQSHLPFFQQEAALLNAGLQKGVSFHELIKEKDYFTKELEFVVLNGQRTGFLGADLENYSHLLYNELDDDLKKMMDLLQPIVFIIIGGFIFVLFLAIMLPMFQMISALQ